MSADEARPIILVAEDEYFIAMEISRQVEKTHGMIARPTGDVGDARRIAAGEKIDGALLDINLHGDLSFDLARTMHDAGSPVAFISGYGRESIPDEFNEIPLVSKPYTPEQLSRVCDWMLKRIRHRGAREWSATRGGTPSDTPAGGSCSP